MGKCVYLFRDRYGQLFFCQDPAVRMIYGCGICENHSEIAILHNARGINQFPDGTQEFIRLERHG